MTGSGRADKAQVTAMVARLLRLADPPRPADAADALALAICHIWRGGAQARLAAAAGAGRRALAAAALRQAGGYTGGHTGRHRRDEVIAHLDGTVAARWPRTAR